MTIHENIKEKIKEAMKNKDQIALNVYRGILSSFTNELVAKNRMPQELLTDEDALAVIMRTAKQRKDAIEQFEKGGRQDLADEDKAQLKILETFLPEMMSEDEVRIFVETKKSEIGIYDPSKKGMIMGKIMGELKGKADGGVVKKVVDEMFSSQN